MSGWDDSGGAEPSKLTVALLVVVGLLFVVWAATPIVAEFIGAWR